ncbi:unnamed protein product [Larinioides sclopetarius]|uniref:Acetoacetyl-CoA synthetase n=1 Tax=Larinioides sclopetarius TaxID=280406 RepID=A0AAV2B100_9ARAC
MKRGSSPSELVCFTVLSPLSTMLSTACVQPYSTTISHTSNKNLSPKGFVDIISTGTRQIWNKKVPGTQMEKLRNIIQDKYGVKFENYWDFHEWSIKNYSQFWEEVWNFYEVVCSKPYDQPSKRIGDRIIDVEWFPGAELNYAENILRYRDDGVALICVDEDGKELKVTFAQMYEEVRLYAAAFKKIGLQKGDRVACYMSNRREAIYSMLAAASMGAMFGGPLPFYGPKAVAAIMNIMKPKFLITVDIFQFNKREFNTLDSLPEIVNDQEFIEKVIIIPTREGSKLKDISSVNNSCLLDEFLKGGRNSDGNIPELVFEQFSFNQPVFINFTSGTTGLPKGLVHSAGVGWNLWNLYIGNLMLGSSLLLYDGCPYYLSKTAFWDIMDKYKVTFAFIVTSVIDAFEKEDIVPAPDCKLEHLKLLSIGASPVKLQNIDFILKKVKPDFLVGCLYGATEVIGVFSGFDYNSPVYSSEIQCPALGVDIRIFDDKGNSIVGKSGELVIATPTPSFPVCLWNDEGGSKMQDTYFSKFPNVWAQSDEAWIDPKTRGIIIIGRSDCTIKQHGQRFASEDIYWAIHDIEEIADSICVAQVNDRGDSRAILFVKVKNGHILEKDIICKIEENILKEFTIFYIPKVILQVKDIPTSPKGFVDIISTGTRQIWNKKVPGTQMEKLRSIIQDKYGVKFENYWDFHEWSIKNYSQFWEEVWNFYEVVCSKPYDQPSRRIGDRIIDVEWFPGAELNYAENILRYRDDGVALICVDEDGKELKVTFAQMYEEVRLYAAAFKKIGLQKGDRVACYMSNRREAIYSMLAVASMGAMFGGPLPFYGPKVGWNLWNLYIGNLMLGSSLLLYDGCPYYLSKTAFWDIMDKYKVTFAFIVTSVIDAFEKEDIVPAPDCKLEHLKLLSIGASPVKLQNIDFILKKVKPDFLVGCLYGATEVIGVFSGFDYNSPVYSSEIQCPALGVDIRIFDDKGNSIVGKSGELVIATPTPSFPVCLWNDEGGSKMQDTYFSKFPNVWAQSDEAWIDPKTRGIIIIGRSDCTIKQHGQRFASEDIYWAIHDIEEIADSICVAQVNDRGDSRAILFVKVKNGHILEKDIICKIEENILKEFTIFYIPKVILQVKDIPTSPKGFVDIISTGTRQIWNKKVPGTQMEKLRSIIQDKYGVKFENYWDFHEWSIKNYSQFWEEVWNFYEVVCSKPYDQPSRRIGDRIIDVEWFPGAELNYAENILRYRDDGVALICVDEDGKELNVTFAQMYEEVRLYAAAFKKIGLQKGDRVACYMSNRREAIYSMLAAASMGAMFGGPLPFYGPKTVAAIMNIMKPKFLITVDRFQFNKREFNTLDSLPEIVNDQEFIEKVIIIPTREGSKLKDISSVNNSCFLDEFLKRGRNSDGNIPELVFEQFSFNQPVFINFTSGTTGLPKGLVHSAGTFLPLLRDFGLHCNLDRTSVTLAMQPASIKQL